MTPVWQWHGDTGWLHELLTTCPLVAIGGLVHAMRERDSTMLTELQRLCERWPARFHVLGCNWPKALTTIFPLLHSADSSKHLDAARYGHLAFIHTKTGKLQFAPAKVLGFPNLSRTDRIRLSAHVMNEYLNRGSLVTAA